MSKMQQASMNQTIQTDKRGGFSMVTLMKKRMNNEKGLTLIELLAVIVIIAVIAAIAVPAIGNIIENSRIKAVKADAVNILNAANLYYTENGTGTAVSHTNTEFTGKYLQSSGKITTYTVSTDLPYKITATVTLTGNKKVIFTAASLSDINAESAKSDGTDPNFKVKVE